jgi:hypothetical protein
MSHVTVTPAYGRDYRSRKAAVAAWEAGDDFILACYGHPFDGLPCNVESLQEGGDTYDSVNIRYNRLRAVCVVKL